MSLLAGVFVLLAGTAPAGAASLKACRLKGVEHEALCGTLQRPLDPAQPNGAQITLHYAVLPALARRKAPDPVFFFAGGPGQSAVQLAGPLSKRFARFSNRRDLVFVDQRGTGDSAPLKCTDDAERQPPKPLAELFDETRLERRMAACRAALQQLPHGDLTKYTTSIAVADIDAVRQALGAARINAIGASYGTRAVLEYQRQFPQQLRRVVIDGVAPPDMRLPAAFSTDNQAALDAVFAACDRDAACRRRHPALRERWQALLASLPREVSVQHPVSGAPETVRLSRTMLLGAVRGPLYAPMLAAALPAAIDAAAAGRFEPLIGLASALASGENMATGMHFSVVCSEDLSPAVPPDTPPVTPVAVPPAVPPDTPPTTPITRADEGRDFGASFAALYARICADWPRGTPPAAFYRIGPAPAPVLVLSGGADPATPPRHGARTAQALGAKARHVVVPEAGHGVLQLACVRDAVVRFVDADSDDEALKVAADAAGCAASLPRPPAFAPIDAGSPAAGQETR